MDDSALQGQAEEVGKVSRTGHTTADCWKSKECPLDRQACLGQEKAGDCCWQREQSEQDTEVKLPGI